MSHHSVVLWFGIVLPLVAAIYIWILVLHLLIPRVFGIRTSKARGGWAIAVYIRKHGIIFSYTNSWYIKTYNVGKRGFSVHTY